MCTTAAQHRKLINRVTNLDTLSGPENGRRRQLKRAHENQNGKCYWCGIKTFLWWEVTTEEFKKLKRKRLATREHLIPHSHGGAGNGRFVDDQEDNIACACYNCNSIRGNIPHDQFLWVTSTPERYKEFKRRKAQRIQKAKVVKAMKSWFRHARWVEKNCKTDEKKMKQLYMKKV